MANSSSHIPFQDPRGMKSFFDYMKQLIQNGFAEVMKGQGNQGNWKYSGSKSSSGSDSRE